MPIPATSGPISAGLLARKLRTKTCERPATVAWAGDLGGGGALPRVSADRKRACWSGRSGPSEAGRRAALWMSIAIRTILLAECSCGETSCVRRRPRSSSRAVGG
eukprot:scaffold3411_cov83-Phaeocystis_antarctica.AAC.2